MTSCPNCNSDSIVKKGKEFARGIVKQRYKCKSCEVNFYSNEEDQTINLPEPSIKCKSS
jgi:transposase-like protein